MKEPSENQQHTKHLQIVIPVLSHVTTEYKDKLINNCEKYLETEWKKGNCLHDITLTLLN